MADPTGDQERSLLGGRLLGTKPVSDAVASLGKEVGLFIKALTNARTTIDGNVKQMGGRSGASAVGGNKPWNTGSHVGGWGPNGGGATLHGMPINAAGRGYGMADAGLAQPGTPWSTKTQAPVSSGLLNGGVDVRKLAVGGALAGAAAVSSWGTRNQGLLYGSDSVATRAYNNGGYSSIMAAQRSLLMNNSSGTGYSDQNMAQQMAASSMGVAANGSLNGGMKYAGMLNPGLSNVSYMRAQQQLSAATMQNSLRPLGISTLDANGHARPITDVATSVLSRFGANRAMSANQRKDTFLNQNSNINISMRQAGFTDDQINIIDRQGVARSKILAEGGDVNRFESLSKRSMGTGTGATSARKALTKEFGYTFDSQQQDRLRDATSDDRNRDTLKGFRDGVRESSQVMTQLNSSMRGLISTLGLAGPLGNAGALTNGTPGGGGSISGLAGGALNLGANILGYKAISKLGSGLLGKMPGIGRLGGRVASFLGRAAPSTGELATAGETVLGAARGAAGSVMMGAGDMHKIMGDWGTIKGKEGKGGAGKTVSAQSVVSRAEQISRSGQNFGVGHCQTFAQTAAGAGPGAPSAVAAWAAAKFKHTDGNPPGGAFVFWSGGSAGYGHVAISTGGGGVYSTDVKREGRVDKVPIAWFAQNWKSVHYLGWTEDNNGTRVKVGNVTSGAMSASADGSDASGASESNGASPVNAMPGLSGGAYGSVNEADAISGALAGSVASVSGGRAGTTSPGGEGFSAPSSGSSRAPKGRLAGILAKAGFKGSALGMANAIMEAESGGNSRSHNTNSRTGDNSYGLFQINMLGSMGPSRRREYGLGSNDDLFDPLTNARVAFKMSHGGTDWNPWSTYKNGAYKKYMNAYSRGAYDVNDDQTAQVHKGEMIIPAQQAKAIRDSLMQDMATSGASRSSGSKGMSIVFDRNSINIQVDGAMTEESTVMAASRIVKHITEDARLTRMGEGK